ncbi:MAG: glycosyltransferase family 4 protein [Candidatus Lambdaproteobacteria bacterium]|nr:glycosyltransferase family 4 protein [Candidatus Lambdaproteobacteria bacterium]
MEVLTTCCRAFLADWSENHYAPGATVEGAVTVRRFPVDKRREAAFGRVNAKLLALERATLLPGVSPLAPQGEAIFVRENINSKALLEHLATAGRGYDCVLFIPYLYGPIMQGIRLVQDKAILQPCLHDEPYAYLNAIAECFYAAKRVFFNSDGELELALRLYGPGISGKSRVVGEGVELPQPAAADRCDAPPVDGPYVLSLGRRDVGKNTHLLVEAFEAFLARTHSDLKLVIAGPGALPRAPSSPQVIDLGTVSEGDKLALLQHCRALVNLSTNESFSRVMFEAWLMERPVVVHAKCLPTATALQRAGGAGWAAADLDALIGVLREVDAAPEPRIAALGRRGADYARQIAQWDGVIARYLEEIAALAQAGGQRAAPPERREHGVHQVLPDLTYGDAISNQALFLREVLLSLGWRSDIYVRNLGERLEHLGKVLSPGSIPASDVVLYHHSIGSEITDHVVRHPGPKVMLYHNITPPKYVERFDPLLTRLLRQGRADLPRLAQVCDDGLAVSDYNAEELRQAGFRRVRTLPIVIDPAQWAYPADAATLARLRGDGRPNLLFVGRLAPSKCQHDLVECFAHLKSYVPRARLILVGGGEPEHPYTRLVSAAVEAHGLQDDVVIAGQVDEAQLHACYRCADLYVSMSEHEGLGVPLVEAMWFDVPVLAYAGAAVPETLGRGGVLFDSKADLVAVARSAQSLLQDGARRMAVIAAQREARERFTWRRLGPLYGELLGQRPAELLEGPTSGRAPADVPMCGNGRARRPTRDAKRLRVAFVVQRCGSEVNGGAEKHCLEVAKRLHTSCDVEVLTTCALDYITWADHFPPGLDTREGVPIRRFPVDFPRDVDRFNDRIARLRPRRHTASLEEQEGWMNAQGPISSAMRDYIDSHRDDYDAFVFFTYLYATTYRLLPLVQDKAVVLPLDDNDWNIELSMWDRFFERPRRFIFNTPEEAARLRRRFPNARLSGPVLGVGIDPPATTSPESFRERHGLPEHYLLYVGRIEPNKGCGELLEYFLAWRERRGDRRPLVLLGRATMAVPEHPAIRALGFVDEQTKWDALAGCDALVMPSAFESLSMVVLEAWTAGKPVLVNGQCEVLVGQCRRAHGGLWYADGMEFAAALEMLLTEAGPRLGEQGRRYVLANYTWPRILQGFMETIEAL